MSLRKHARSLTCSPADTRRKYTRLTFGVGAIVMSAVCLLADTTLPTAGDIAAAQAASPADSVITQAAVREIIAAHDRKRILDLGERSLTVKPFSVAYDSSPLSEGGLNDFFSMSDYFWPDPSKPDGRPYVPRDGESNPDNFNKHRESLMAMRDATAALAAAYTLTKDEKYAGKAAELLKVFFVDPATRMNPRLDYAQVIVGKATPNRGIGLIDTLHLVEVPIAIRALKGSKALTPELLAQFKQWFADYNVWLTTSSKGKSEAAMINNHAVAYWLQVASFSVFTENEVLLSEGRQKFKETFVSVQMDRQGSFPNELRRTKPYAYSIFQLDNMAALCHLLHTSTENLWNYRADGGQGMSVALSFMYPYLADKSRWPLKPDVQAWEGWPVRQASLFLGGAAFGEAKYLELWKRLKQDSASFEIRRNNAITQPVLWMLPRP